MLDVFSYASPVGELALVASGNTLRVLSYPNYWPAFQKRLEQRHGPAALRQATSLPGITPVLDRYFAGDVTAVDTLEVEPEGTEFQVRAWRALREIPAGQTWSYGDLARRIGAPTAVRAIGAANGANPISIVLPCHRVIGSDGSLTGYGGGLERKRWLLDHEQRHCGQRLF